MFVFYCTFNLLHAFFYQQVLQEGVNDIEAALKLIEDGDSDSSSSHTRAQIAFVRGAAWNALNGYSRFAEENLNKSVKLDHTNHAAWNALGIW